MTLDSILNAAVPILLICIAAGWVYIKFLGPHFVPWIKKAWEKYNENPQQIHKQREIMYE